MLVNPHDKVQILNHGMIFFMHAIYMLFLLFSGYSFFKLKLIFCLFQMPVYLCGLKLNMLYM